jgi:hypothetical protein
LQDSKEIVFIAEFTLNNTGERPINLEFVNLMLVKSLQTKDNLLVPDKDEVIAKREISGLDDDKRGVFEIQAGERSIFTLRCILPSLDNVVFILCSYKWKLKRTPSTYIGLHVKQEEKPQN